uniref:hypothetical protein n=1 Tax=Rhodococcus qingshengii TaxID=334542 RepID=UPI001C4DED76|nr:hypothetical protein [Rhodococcus qingshengii]
MRKRISGVICVFTICAAFLSGCSSGSGSSAFGGNSSGGDDLICALFEGPNISIDEAIAQLDAQNKAMRISWETFRDSPLTDEELKMTNGVTKLTFLGSEEKFIPLTPEGGMEKYSAWACENTDLQGGMLSRNDQVTLAKLVPGITDVEGYADSQIEIYKMGSVKSVFSGYSTCDSISESGLDAGSFLAKRNAKEPADADRMTARVNAAVGYLCPQLS